MSLEDEQPLKKASKKVWYAYVFLSATSYTAKHGELFHEAYHKIGDGQYLAGLEMLSNFGKDLIRYVVVELPLSSFVSHAAL